MGDDALPVKPVLVEGLKRAQKVGRVRDDDEVARGQARDLARQHDAVIGGGDRQAVRPREVDPGDEIALCRKFGRDEVGGPPETGARAKQPGDDDFLPRESAPLTPCLERDAGRPAILGKGGQPDHRDAQEGGHPADEAQSEHVISLVRPGAASEVGRYRPVAWEASRALPTNWSHSRRS